MPGHSTSCCDGGVSSSTADRHIVNRILRCFSIITCCNRSLVGKAALAIVIGVEATGPPCLSPVIYPSSNLLVLVLMAVTVISSHRLQPGRTSRPYSGVTSPLRHHQLRDHLISEFKKIYKPSMIQPFRCWVLLCQHQSQIFFYSSSSSSFCQWLQLATSITYVTV